MYACHQGELIVIKEQGYLQKEMAEEEYLNSQGKGGAVYLEQEMNTQFRKELSKESLKIPQSFALADKGIGISQDPEKNLQDVLAQQNRNTIEEATSMLHECQDDIHKQAVVQWNLKRRERKQLEQDLLQYQVRGASGRSLTDQVVEQARMYINVEHTKKLKEELPYIT